MIRADFFLQRPLPSSMLCTANPGFARWMLHAVDALACVLSFLFYGVVASDQGEALNSRAALASSKDIPPVFGDSRKIPQQITAIAHFVRKSGGRPRMLLMPLGEVSLYRTFFSDRVYEVRERLFYGILLGWRFAGIYLTISGFPASNLSPIATTPPLFPRPYFRRRFFLISPPSCLFFDFVSSLSDLASFRSCAVLALDLRKPVVEAVRRPFRRGPFGVQTGSCGR